MKILGCDQGTKLDSILLKNLGKGHTLRQTTCGSGIEGRKNHSRQALLLLFGARPSTLANGPIHLHAETVRA